MAAAMWAAMRVGVPALGLAGRAATVAQLVAGLLVGTAALAAAAWALRITELADLFRRSPGPAGPGDAPQA
jgi:hypothetical protein